MILRTKYKFGNFMFISKKFCYRINTDAPPVMIKSISLGIYWDKSNFSILLEPTTNNFTFMLLFIYTYISIYLNRGIVNKIYTD